MMRIFAVSLFVLCCLSFPARAEETRSIARQGAPAPPTGELGARAVKAGVQPILDGSVVDDPAWASAPIIKGFWQIAPSEGAPASEETEVRVIYSEDTLYVGVVAYDRNPDQIIVADSRRDSSLDETDSFLIVFDTYRDRQNGFVFGTNPAAIQYDGQVTNEGGTSPSPGGGGGQQGGSGGGFNINWDGDWQVRAQTSAIGWSAEFAIPFRTLRYPQQELQTWGVNFQRNIRRHNETSFWAPLPRQYNLYRVSLAGQLSGVQSPRQRNLQLTPYVLGQTRQHGMRPSGTTSVGDVGLDMKYSVTPSLTLDATYNTDFAQVEVDEQQVNLDRFSLFFAEKRPFFLENAGLFAVGSPREAEIFFSRSIGIGPDGQAIPIIGGARLTGRIGATNVGMLNIQTDEVAGVAGSNFAVARVNHELPNRSAIGAIVVNRQGVGSYAGPGDENQSYAVDGRWGVGKNGRLAGFVARTATPGVDDAQHAYQLDSTYSSQAWTLAAAYLEVAENFNPEVGFLSRGSFRKFNTSVNHRYRPSRGPFQELRPHVNVRSYWDFGGFHETFYMHMDQHWQTKPGHEFHTGLNITREGLKEPFTIYPGIVVPPGTYDHKEAQLVFFSNQGAPVSIDTRVTAGGFFGGRRTAFNPSLRFRLGEEFNSEVGLSRNDVSLPGGSFVTNLVRARVSYSFSPSVFVQSLVQYNDRADLWSTNLRFGWYQKGSTGVFVVYNDTQGLADSTLLRPDRSLVIKVSRLVDVLN
jgi:hypothetical protein